MELGFEYVFDILGVGSDSVIQEVDMDCLSRRVPKKMCIPVA